MRIHPDPSEPVARLACLRISLKSEAVANIMKGQWHEIRNDWQNDDWYDRAEATATFYDNAIWDEVLECWTVPIPELKKVAKRRKIETA